MLDVVVIGAGLSGLQAALGLQAEGLSILVVEARSRVGGKSWSVPLASGRGCVELGGAWINDTNQHRMFSYAQRFGLELVKQNVDGDCVMDGIGGALHRFPYGESPRFSPAEVRDLERVRDILHEMSLRTMRGEVNLQEEDNLTLAEFVKKHHAGPKAVKTINVWARVMLGVEASEVSARFFIEYTAAGGGLLQMRSDQKHGGQYLRFRHGSQNVANGIATLLSPDCVRLSTPIKSIQDLGTHVVTTSSDGSAFTSKKVILSIPTPLYNNITFNPPLQGDKLKASSSTTLGYYTKVIVCYATAWWRTEHLCGLSISFRGPVVVARDTSTDIDGQYSLTCFVNGHVGREWSRLSPHERRAQVLSHVAYIYGNKEAAYQPLEIFEQEWTKEEWSQGAVCPVTSPSIINQVGYAAKLPVGNLHFVGTEFATEWKGYMEGALCSGEQGSREVLETLCTFDSPTKSRL